MKILLNVVIFLEYKKENTGRGKTMMIPEMGLAPWLLISSSVPSKYLSLRVLNSILLSNVLVYLHQSKITNTTQKLADSKTSM